jgi:hypothetical protein
MPEVTKASRVSYTKEDLQNMREEERLAEGIWVAGVVDEWKSFENEAAKTGTVGKDLVATAKVAVLDPRNISERTKWAVSHYMFMPLRHPDFMDTHKPAAWGKDTMRTFFRATLPKKHEAAPRFNSTTKQWIHKGKKITAAEVDAIEEALDDKILQECETQYNEDGKDVLKERHVFYFKTKWSGNFTNMSYVSAELPDGATLATKDELTTMAAKSRAGTPAKSNGKKNGGAGRARAVKTTATAKGRKGRRRS